MRALLQGAQPQDCLRVLIVEDSSTLAGLLQHAFAAHGYRAETVGSVAAAAEAFGHAAYDVAVLDYHLPDGQGDALLEDFAARRPACVCLMMTADPTPELTLTWMKQGAADCLRKPFAPEYLLALCVKARRARALLQVEDLLEARTRQLRESEERFRSLLQHVPSVAVQSYTSDGTAHYWNHASERLYGYTAQEAIGRNVLDLLIPPDMRGEVEQAVRQMAETGLPIPAAERSLLRKDGSRIAVFSSHALAQIPGRAPEVFCLDIDLTDRKQAEEILLARTDQLEAVGIVSREITRELHLDTVLQAVLQRALALLKVPVGTVYLWDEDSQRLVPGAWQSDDPRAGTVRLSLDEGVAGTVAHERVGRIVNNFSTSPYAITAQPTGMPHTAVLATPLLYGDRLLGVLALNNGTTERRFGPADLEFLQLLAAHAAIAIENARLYTTTQQALADVQHAQGELVRAETLRGLGQMAAGIAHDLNNTLATVLGQAELAKLTSPSPELQEILALIETAAADGAAVVRRVLEFARPKGTSPLAPCDLAALVREALKFTRPRWQAAPQRRGVTIDIVCDLPDLPPILGHPSELREALTNLFFNAVDAMPTGGTLTIAGRVVERGTGGTTAEQWTGNLVESSPPRHQSTAPPVHADGGFVELTVTDTGIGMPPEVQAKLFEPFFTTKGVTGTGLGLAVVYGILARHGGRITVTSALGLGTTFTLTFPRDAAPSQVPGAPPTGADLPPLRRLLVVDDEPLVRRTLVALLRAAGHGVIEAPDGATALALLATTPVDCVLTDLGMPGMSGWELARTIKQRRPPLPVLLLTGWQDQAPGDDADRQAVDAVLRKPVRLAELQQVVEAITCPGEPGAGGAHR